VTTRTFTTLHRGALAQLRGANGQALDVPADAGQRACWRITPHCFFRLPFTPFFVEMFMPELTRQFYLATMLKAEAGYRVLLLCGEARPFLERMPGLGVTIPLFFAQCGGRCTEATGLVVAGTLDAVVPEEGFDIDGQFVLFSTDHRDADEFVTVNGWIGAITILARRQGDFFTLQSIEGSRP